MGLLLVVGCLMRVLGEGKWVWFSSWFSWFRVGHDFFLWLVVLGPAECSIEGAVHEVGSWAGLVQCGRVGFSWGLVRGWTDRA